MPSSSARRARARAAFGALFGARRRGPVETAGGGGGNAKPRAAMDGGAVDGGADARAAMRAAAAGTRCPTMRDGDSPTSRARMREEATLRARLFEADAARRRPQVDARARASSAAAEVRAARAANAAAREAAREEVAARERLFARASEGRRERDRASARLERAARAALFARDRSHSDVTANALRRRPGTSREAPTARARSETVDEGLGERHGELLRRAALHGSLGQEVSERLRAMGLRRSAAMRRWDGELDEIAAVLDEAERTETRCVIDLSVMEKGQLAVRLPCLHVFHAECMMPYLQSSQSPECPIDRTAVPKHIVPYLPVWPWAL